MRPVFLLPVLFLSAAAPAAETVLGVLGRARSAFPIKSSLKRRASTLWRTKPGQNLVVIPFDATRIKVRMADGRTGYAPLAQVEVLPYRVVRKDPTASRSGGGGARLVGTSGEALAQYSLNFVGTPYVWGGNDIQRGIDCSAFVKKLYGMAGVGLPRTAAEQALVGQEITRYEDLLPGDRLYFWETRRNKIGHTGMYIGGGRFVHSSTGHGGVATDYLTERWRKILITARR